MVTLNPNNRSLDADFYYLQVQATEHLQDGPPIAPLSLADASTSQYIEQSSSSSLQSSEQLQADPLTTLPSIDHTEHQDALLTIEKNKALDSRYCHLFARS